MEQHECKHEAEFIQIRDEHKDMIEVARSHVTWTTFWAIIVLLVGIFTGTINFILREKDNIHDKLDSRVTALEVGDQDFKVNYATIMVQLSQIQKDIVDVKAKLELHDKPIK